VIFRELFCSTDIGDISSLYLLTFPSSQVEEDISRTETEMFWPLPLCSSVEEPRSGEELVFGDLVPIHSLLIFLSLTEPPDEPLSGKLSVYGEEDLGCLRDVLSTSENTKLSELERSSNGKACLNHTVNQDRGKSMCHPNTNKRQFWRLLNITLFNFYKT